MSNKNIKKNYIYNVFYQILLVLTPVITIPYLSRILGVDGVGYISFAESIVAYFVLFATLGINTYGQREISYAQDDIVRRSEVFYNTFVAKLISSIVVLFIYIIFLITYLKSTVYIVLSILIISVTFDITWFFQGLEEFKIIVIRNTILKVASIIYIFTFVKGSNAVLLYVVGTVSFTLLCNLSLWPSLSKHIVRTDLTQLKIDTVFKESLTLFLPTIAIQIYTVLDKTMIGIITKDLLENGYYEQAMKITKFLLMIITALSTVVIPRIGYYFDKKDEDSLKNLLYKSYRFVFLLAVPMCLGLYHVSSYFVPWFLGESFNKSIILIKILSFLLLIIGLSNVTGLQYFVPTKKQHKLTISVVIGALINFSLNIVLIIKFKSVGAAIASIIAELTITIIQLILARDFISFGVIIKNAYKYLASGFIMILVLSIFTSRFTPSIISSILISLFGVMVYFISLIILRDEFFINNIKYIQKSIKFTR